MIIKKAFLELLQQKSMSKITVREICEKAEINRSTFYKHYLDCYDLMDESSWYFRYFPGPVNALSVPDIIRSADSGSAYVTLVLTDEQAFDSFRKYCDDLQGEADATANLDGVCAPELPSVSLILYDEKTGNIDDWTFDD